MFDSQSIIQLYGGRFIDEVFPIIFKEISTEISKLSDHKLNETDENELAETLTTKYHLDFPEIHFDKVYISTSEKDIPSKSFPSEFDVYPGKSYKRDVILYHIPYTGDIEILTFKPNPFSTFSGYSFLIDRQDKSLVVEVTKFYDDPEKIKQAYEDKSRYITRDYGSLKNNCKSFNDSLKENILNIIITRKNTIKEKKQFLSDLGMPIKSELKKEENKLIPEPINKNTKHKTTYDLAISFAGEDRKVAEDIASKLKQLGYSVFYDKDEQATLWGKDLYEHLNDIYSKKANFCLMIISNNYANKLWTNHERKAAQAKAFTQNTEYILPLRLDETEIPGLNITVSYIDYTQTGLEGTIDLLNKKLNKNGG